MNGLMMKYFRTIGFRLIVAAVSTCAIALLLLSMIVSNRLHHGLDVQSEELGRLSEELLLQQLYGESHVARDRLEELSNRVIRETQNTSQRQSTMKAIFTGNDVAISESLKIPATNPDIDFYLAVNERGRVIGTSKKTNFFSMNDALDEAPFSYFIFPIISDNERAKPITHQGFYPVNASLMRELGYTANKNYAYVSIQPVFDDFGETTGGIVGIRFLKEKETSLARFATLSSSNVFVIKKNDILSRTDEGKVTNLRLRLSHLQPGDPKEVTLMQSDGEAYIASCAKYLVEYNVCVSVSSLEVAKLKAQMSDIGRDQTSKIQLILYAVAALMVAALALVLFHVIRATMYGLPQLAIAANTVAAGDLNVPFKSAGYGEIRELSKAFERMLAHLRNSNRKIQQLAYYCPVTGLANREKMQEESKKLFKLDHGDSTPVMMVINLKRFKAINENYGMKAGDFVLKKTGERLTNIFEFFGKHGRVDHLTLAHTSGTDFVVAFTTKAAKAELGKLAEIIIASLAKPLRIGSSNVIVDTNIGISLYPEDGNSFDELMSHTQMAIETIDKKGPSDFAFFDNSLAKAAHERLEIEAELREALATKSLRVYYQPKVSLDSGLMQGGEALVRWIHPVKGFISPAKFIPVAEEAGMIGDIGRFVMERAVEETKILLDEGHKITVAVNVSALQLEDPSFAEEVLSLIARKNFPAAALELEITESMAMSDPQGVKERISVLREKGIRFSMDDFGTGYSNLSQLATMPIDVLKLDRSLIMDVDKDEKKQALARSILELAADFGFKTVVEGVENAGELAFCVNHDADMVQGFIFSGAQPLEKYRPFLLKNAEGKTEFLAKFDDIGGTRDQREKNLLRHVKSPKVSDLVKV
jgi:diguanylate cyclase (GGDEF)-like protein